MGPPEQEFERRRRRLIERFGALRADGCVIFGGPAIHYFTGFSYIPGERPLAIVITADGDTVGIVPRLEREHFEQRAFVDRVEHYEEYPGTRHPMYVIADAIASAGLDAGVLGADATGASSRNGYRGPLLGDVVPRATIVPLQDEIERLRRIKSEVEIDLIRASLRWAEHAHRLLQAGVAAGRTELEVAAEASWAASRDLLASIGDDYDPGAWLLFGASAGFRGQVGANAALPHAMHYHRPMVAGDVLVTGASAKMWGYGPAVERTLFVGEPPDDSRTLFEIMVGAQDVALAAVRPGVPCTAVDGAVREYFRRLGVEELWRHHTGHSFGLESHEAPYLDIGDATMLEPGMVFAVEPGVYRPGLGGYRHQDIVLVTEVGNERLTSYPRDLMSLICT